MWYGFYNDILDQTLCNNPIAPTLFAPPGLITLMLLQPRETASGGWDTVHLTINNSGGSRGGQIGHLPLPNDKILALRS